MNSIVINLNCFRQIKSSYYLILIANHSTSLTRKQQFNMKENYKFETNLCNKKSFHKDSHQEYIEVYHDIQMDFHQITENVYDLRGDLCVCLCIYINNIAKIVFFQHKNIFSFLYCRRAGDILRLDGSFTFYSYIYFV
jgi:hypothetical protein